MRLRHRPLVALVAFLAAGSPGALDALAQVCRDEDADGALFGPECASSTDCRDLSWSRHPGALDTCDGFDNDCNELVDDGGCDRNCEFPFLPQGRRELVDEGAPVESSSVCAAMTDSGLLAVTRRVYRETGQPTDYRLHATLFDRNGQALGPTYLVGETDAVDPSERRCSLTDAGDRVLLVWEDNRTRSQGTSRLVARLLDSTGRPLGAVVDLSASSPVGSAPWLYHGAAWDGSRFAIFWAPASPRRYLLASLLERDGSPAAPLTRIVTDRINAAASEIQEVDAVWAGSKYVLALWHDGTAPDANLRLLGVDAEGVLLSNQAVPAFTRNITLVIGTDRVAIATSASAIPTTKVRIAFSDLDGNYLSDPGVIQLMQVTSDWQAGNLRASWSGEQFGINQETFESLAGGGFLYRQHFMRVLPTGVNLDPGGRLLSQGGDHDRMWFLQWTGDDWALVEQRNGTETRPYLERIVCSCSDLDGDTYDACAESDCNDRSAAAHPGAGEVCHGLVDEDCDGFLDCEDPDCTGGAGPADLTDLRWDGTILRWTAPAGAQRFDLARGRLSDVARRGDLLQSECAGVELVTPQWADDGRVPPPGEGLWYLVRAEGPACAFGGWGAGTPARDVKACH